MKKTLPSISVVLYTSKQLANGEHPIMLRVTYNNQRKYKGIGISCQKKDWNEKKGEVRATHPNAVNINTLIRSEKKKAEEVVLTLEKSGVVYSAQSIIKATTRTAVTNKTLYTLFEERITFFKEKAEQYNTSTGYTTLLNIIKRYTDNVDVELIDVDSNWIRDFEAHLRIKYKDTSIKKFFDCLKAAFNYAVSKNYITKSPLENYTHIRKLDTRTKKRALSFPEITQLQKYYIDTYGIMGDKTTDLEVCKKHYWNKKFRRRGTTKLTPIDAEQLSLCLFLCSYYMQGLALIDMANLKWKDLQDFEVVDKQKFLSDTALHGLEYAQEHKQFTEYYKIEVARAKTNHPVRIIVEVEVILPFLLPFTNDLKGLTEEEQKAIRKEIAPAPNQSLFYTTLAYGRLQALFAAEPERKLESLQADEHILLLTGIASPAPLIRKLSEYSPHVTPLTFPDHHAFDAEDMRRIRTAFEKLPEGKRLVITTEKDAARLIGHPDIDPGLTPYIYVLPVEVSFLNEEERIMFNQNIIAYVRENTRNSRLSEG